jgi:arabinosyltransferase
LRKIYMQVFFKKWRHTPQKERKKPVMVHINYHPNKVERMHGIIEYYKTGNEHWIMQFPGGSEAGT